MHQYFSIDPQFPFFLAFFLGFHGAQAQTNFAAQSKDAPKADMYQVSYTAALSDSVLTAQVQQMGTRMFPWAAEGMDGDSSGARGSDVTSTKPLPSAIQVAAPPAHRHAWGPNTSGPFFTGTAETEPVGSMYLEPFMFDYRKNGSQSDTFTQKMAIGMGHNLEFDVLIPLINNTVTAPSTSPSSPAMGLEDFGPGDTHLYFKYGLLSDANTHEFLVRPAISLTADFLLPTGNTAHLSGRRGGADQLGNGTYQEGISLMVHKRAKPFAVYGQFGDLVANPATVSAGYGFDNGIGTVSSGNNVRMVDGNLVYYSTAIEYVLNDKHGIGFLTEASGQSQSGRNLFFGKATAPSYSYLWLAPEVEFTWPVHKSFSITWGAGVAFTVHRNNYARTLTPMMTATFYFNGPKGSRDSE